MPREAVERLCREFDGIVVIDEAYVDFAEDDCMDFAKRHENAIVMRTFSKSFSLAGLRLGLGVANPIIIAEFLKTRIPKTERGHAGGGDCGVDRL